MKKEIICIHCPKGCRIQVETDGEVILNISSGSCKRGQVYARQEILAPMRILTGNMRVEGCHHPLSVISDAPLPKAMLYACALELKKYRPAPPIAINDIVIKNILDTGCNIIATRNLAI